MTWQQIIELVLGPVTRGQATAIWLCDLCSWTQFSFWRILGSLSLMTVPRPEGQGSALGTRGPARPGFPK